MPPRIVARQLACPNGLLGPLIARVMNRHNAKMNAFALKMLEPSSSDRVLEIGFGGGVNLPSLIRSTAFIAGVDRSPLVVRRATARFAQAVIERRANFQEGRADKLAFDSASFDKVCTVNTIYFWPSLQEGLREIFRVLAPGGRAVIGFLPKEWMDQGNFPSEFFTPRTPEEVVEALSQAGFRAIRLERPLPATRWNVAVATR